VAELCIASPAIYKMADNIDIGLLCGYLNDSAGSDGVLDEYGTYVGP
jgi:hypothetical protein